MADDTGYAPQNNTHNTLPAVQRTKAIVADTIPVFDTNRFEHYGRIATVLADSSLVPDTLKDRDNRQVSIANCFQVVELADRWGYSPFAVAQCSSVVHGKLMLEGKLVSAVLQSKLGLQLHHYFTGEWGNEDYRIFVTDRELSETEVEELKPHQKIHGVRMIDGSVKEWRTHEKGNGKVKGNWLNQPDVQLVYRGDRTWARVFESAVMLGVYTEDEFEDLQDRRLTPDQPSLTAGMDALPGPKSRPRKPKEAEAGTTPAAEASEAAPGAAVGQEGAGQSEAGQDAAHDAEFEDAKPEGEQGGAEPSTSTGSSESANEPTQTATTDVSTATSATDERTDAGSATAKVRAPTGELYCLSTDEVGEDGKLPTYKDGVPFSRVKADSKARPATYDLHPLVAEDDDEGEAAAEGASNEGAKQEAAEAGEAVTAFTHAISAIGDAKGYLQAKQVVKTLSGAPEWQEGSAEAKARVRKALWARYVDLRDAGEESISPHEELHLMQAFLEFGATTQAAIDQMWRPFWKGQAYKNATDASQRAITDLMVKRKGELPA